MERKARIHGFEWPFHPTQVLSWVEFALTQTLLVLMFLYSFTAGEYVVLNGIMLLINLLLSLMVVIGAIVITSSNPTYDGSSTVTHLGGDSECFSAKEFSFLCDICKIKVPERVKHCAECNRCIVDFDHHCIWLNNCIGKHNYTQYFNLIILFAVQGLLQLGYLVTFAVLVSISRGKMIALWVYIGLILLKVVSISYLNAWHIYLSKEGISTYKYLVEK